MVLVDTSVWIDVFRDASNRYARQLKALTRDQDIVLTRFNQLELLQGASSEHEWTLLGDYLTDQIYLETSAQTWPAAARLYFDLRRNGKTVRSTIDCCIAQLAMEHGTPLLHRDRDFAAIASVCALSEQFIEWA